MYILRVVMETEAPLKPHVQLRGSGVFRQYLPHSSSDKRGKATVIRSTGDFMQTVDRVRALTACMYYLSLADQVPATLLRE